jgi:putative chitinase
MPTRNEISMLNAARAAGITSRDELANFMGQLGHESGGFTTLEESFRYTRGIDQIPVRSALREGEDALEAARLDALAGRPQELARLMYGGRMGNDDAGDGYRYRGRGFIMLTGEENYRTRGEAVELDLLRDPDLAADRDNASRIAVSYWQDRVPAADRDDVSASTLAINGGENGLADRYNRFDAWYAQLAPEFMADLAAGRVQPGSGVAPAVGLAANADGILRRGETGVEVTQLRIDLHTLGIRDDRNRVLTNVGSFDATVEQAVRRFQEQQGLPVNGRAGPETLESLRAALELQRERRPARAAGPDAHDPRNPDHPAHALDRRIRGEIARAEAMIGKPWDESSERLTASLFGLAREMGFSEHDDLKVGFNRRTAAYGAGELVFVYREGGNVSPDPRANRAHMATSAAIGQPADDIYRRIGAEAHAQQQAQVLAQQPGIMEEQRNPTRSI